MKNICFSFLYGVLLVLFPAGLLSQEDHSHYSEVFGRDKPYRIFLPADYSTSGKSYPVIYYCPWQYRNPCTEII